MEVFGRGELGFSVFEQHRIVKVFDSRGERFANVVIPYGGRSEVVAIEARTISPDGTIVVLDENDIYDVSLYPNFVFFSDQRAKLFTLPRDFFTQRVPWPKTKPRVGKFGASRVSMARLAR